MSGRGVASSASCAARIAWKPSAEATFMESTTSTGTLSATDPAAIRADCTVPLSLEEPSTHRIWSCVSASERKVASKRLAAGCEVVGNVPDFESFSMNAAGDTSTPSRSVSWPKCTFSGTTAMPYRCRSSADRSDVLSVTIAMLRPIEVSFRAPGPGPLTRG